MALTESRLPRDSVPFRQLKAKHILSDTGTALPLQLLATKFRTKKAFLEGFTNLHIFVVTLRCDQSCPYCQVSRVSTDRTRFDMSRDTAERAIDVMFKSPSPDLKVEFQGGESLLNTELVRFIVERVNARNAAERRNIEFVIATNLSELSAETLALCAQHQIHLSTSLDGPAWLHNANRPRPGGDSHERVIRNLGVARAALGRDRVSALMTTTTRSLDVPQEIEAAQFVGSQGSHRPGPILGIVLVPCVFSEQITGHCAARLLPPSGTACCLPLGRRGQSVARPLKVSAVRHSSLEDLLHGRETHLIIGHSFPLREPAAVSHGFEEAHVNGATLFRADIFPVLLLLAEGQKLADRGLLGSDRERMRNLDVL